MGRPPKEGILQADTVSKKDRLTLGELAIYDDLLTDILLDHVRFRLLLYLLPY